MARYGRSCEWGTIFGLSSTELTDEQLSKVDADKLFEFVLADSRVTKIVANKLENGDLNTFQKLSSFSREEFINNTLLYTTYNDCQRKYADFFDKKLDNYYFRRHEVCKWEFLDEQNKHIEFDRYLDGRKSSVQFNYNFNMDGLYEKYTRIDELMKKLVNTAVNREVDKVLLSSLPKKYVDMYYNDLIINRSPYSIFYLLQNQALSEEQTIKVLRRIAGKSDLPTIDIKAHIDKKMLKKIPPVTRLRVLETLYGSSRRSNIIVDINKDTDLNDILFGVSLRYNYRVQQVIGRFRRLVEG